jgi:excisionase family DNA binding protein
MVQGKGYVVVSDARLLTAKEIAERLRVPETWIRQETRAERIPHIKLGRYRRYQWEPVAAWLEQQRAGRIRHARSR